MSRIFALILAFVTPVAAVAAEPTPTQIDELMHKSGLWNQLSEIQSAFDQGLSDVGAAILINVNAGIVRGFGAAIPGYMGPDADDIRKQMEAQRPQLAAVMEQQQLTFFVAAYASLSDEELERYIEFAKSPAGGRYQAATITALDRALTDAANEAGSTLVRKNQV